MDHDSGEDLRPLSRRPSEAGIAACLLAVPMIALELRLLVLIMRGVKDNQGYLYAAFPTFAVVVLGLPTCLLLLLAGLMQGSRSRTSAWLGLALALGVALSALLVIRAVPRPERPRPRAAGDDPSP